MLLSLTTSKREAFRRWRKKWVIPTPSKAEAGLNLGVASAKVEWEKSRKPSPALRPAMIQISGKNENVVIEDNLAIGADILHVDDAAELKNVRLKGNTQIS